MPPHSLSALRGSITSIYELDAFSESHLLANHSLRAQREMRVADCPPGACQFLICFERQNRGAAGRKGDLEAPGSSFRDYGFDETRVRCV